MVKSRRLLFSASLSVVLAAALLAGCGNQGAKSQPAPSAAPTAAPAKPEVVKVIVGTAKDPNLAAPLIVAVKKGFLTQQGLDAEIKYFPTGGDLVAAAASGSIKLAITGDAPALNLRAGGADIQILAQTADISGAQAILVKPEFASNLSKLKGARIAVLKGTVGELLLYRFLESVGVSKDDVRLFQLGGGDAITAYLRGDIDAMYLWEPWVVKAKESGARVVSTANFSFKPGSEGPQKLVGIHGVLFGGADYIKANPKLIEGLLKGLGQAVTYIQTNFDDAVQLVGADLNLDARTTAIIMKENVYQMVINQELIGDLDTTAKFLSERGALKSVPAPKDWVNPSLLKSVHAEWVAWTP